MDEWIEALEKAVRMAKDEGHLDAGVDPAQLAFELNALFFGANFACQLRNDPQALDRAEKAIEWRLESLRTRPAAGPAAHAAENTSRRAAGVTAGEAAGVTRFHTRSRARRQIA